MSADWSPLDPRMVKVWTVLAAIASLALVAPITLVDLASAADGDGLPGPTGIATAAVVAIAIAWCAWYPRAAYRHWRYRLAEGELELRHGVILRSHSVIPYYRVQHIDVTQGPIDRAMGLSRLVVHTASAGTDKEIPGVATAAADELRRTILARTGPGDAV